MTAARKGRSAPAWHEGLRFALVIVEPLEIGRCTIQPDIAHLVAAMEVAGVAFVANTPRPNAAEDWATDTAGRPWFFRTATPSGQQVLVYRIDDTPGR